MDERLARALDLCERWVFGGEAAAPEAAARELDAVEADLAMLRGRVAHARFQRDGTADPAELVYFERAAELYRALGDGRGEADAQFWLGTYHQLVRSDHDTAAPVLQRSLELASAAGDREVMAEALRHQGIIEHAAGRLDAARDRLEESTRLRRELGHLPGVAANLVGLAYVAAAAGQGERAKRHLDEAADLAERSGAGRVLHHVEQARERL